MEDRAGFEVHSFGQVHHHLHTHRPFALVVSGREAERGVELAADSADRTVGDHGEGGPDVHAGQKAGVGIALLVHALVGQADTGDAFALDECPLHRHPRPHLHGSGGHQVPADELHKLPERQDQPALLVVEGRDVGKLVGEVPGLPRKVE